jgi:hypothetical protein
MTDEEKLKKALDKIEKIARQRYEDIRFEDSKERIVSLSASGLRMIIRACGKARADFFEDSLKLAEDGLPLDYVDIDGRKWIMAACGHRVAGRGFGDKIALCESCRSTIGDVRAIAIKYPDRAPDPGQKGV